jgi:deazaflavin-dependent oxidoreductase (nitroreductase family)
MPISTFRQALSSVEELTLTVTGRRSRRKISLPVWFVHEGQTLQLLPVTGWDSEWYKNVLHTPAIRLAAKRATITATAKPVTEAAKVRKIVKQLRAKYGAADVKRYFVKFDVGVEVRLPSPPAPTRVGSSRAPSAARRGPGRGDES